MTSFGLHICRPFWCCISLLVSIKSLKEKLLDARIPPQAYRMKTCWGQSLGIYIFFNISWVKYKTMVDKACLMAYKGYPFMELCHQRLPKDRCHSQTQPTKENHQSSWQDSAGFRLGWPQAADVQEQDSLGLNTFETGILQLKAFFKPSHIMTSGSEDRKESRSLSREVERPKAKLGSR